MATWADFYPFVRPSAAGCPAPLLDKELREAAREFLRRTRLWREWLEPVAARQAVRDYDIEVPQGTAVVRVERATVNAMPLELLSHNVIGMDYERRVAEQGGVTTRDRVAFTLLRPLPAGAAIALEASLMPGRRSSGVPDDVFEQHVEAIAAGARARLLVMPEFLNVEGAAIASARFEEAVRVTAVQAWRGFTGKTPRSRVNWV